MTAHEACPLTSIAEVAPGFFLITLDSAVIAPIAEAGQFVHVLTDPQGELLRRPFSIQDTRQRSDGAWEFELLYQVIGEGTRLLAQARVGDLIDCLGPQGHAWPAPASVQSEVALIGGGVGVPPLVFLTRHLRAAGTTVRFFQGARRGELLLMTDRLRNSGATLAVATNDGSAGHRGFVTDLLPPFAEAPYAAIYACGPLPMLQAVARWAGVLGPAEPPRIPVHLSFENKMGCAVGACLGCVIPMRSGRYDRVCTEGPIFNAETVDFQRLASL
ncbi:MAG: dihydroorotate dehydrogenase electron transfer subunit [bacterium]